jgi:3-methyladenine DNA glycosylase AlkD
LQAAIDPVYKEGATRFFKEKILVYGVRVPVVRTIATKYATMLKQEPVAKIWKLSEQLLQTGYIEDATIALALIYKRKSHWQAHDFKTLERWVHTYISNWAICDDLCNHSIGYCVEKFPEVLPSIRTWVKSDNRWVRRASAVSLILPARSGNNLADVLQISQELLHDSDDMVQKGCGWLLKEASKKHQPEIIAYVEMHKKTMPRTMLRYVIEHMPADIKKQLMA